MAALFLYLLMGLVGTISIAPYRPISKYRFGNAPLEPGLVMTKTVSTDGSCGVSNTLTTTWHTAVTYCYTALNSGDVTFTTHTLTDTILGPILEDFPYTLAPQTTRTITASFDPANIPGPIKNCAKWTASDQTNGTTAMADDCATVVIVAPTDVNLTVFVVREQAHFSLLLGALIVLSSSVGGAALVWRKWRK